MHQAIFSCQNVSEVHDFYFILKHNKDLARVFLHRVEKEKPCPIRPTLRNFTFDIHTYTNTNQILVMESVNRNLNRKIDWKEDFSSIFGHF